MKIPAPAAVLAAVAFILGAPAVSPAQQTWVRRGNFTASTPWSTAGVTAGGVFLLTDNNNDVDFTESAHSVDGVTWTPGLMPFGQVFSSGGVSIILGTGKIWTTGDGRTLSNVYGLPDENDSLSCAAMGNGVWVVTGSGSGQNAPVYRSRDLGATWTRDGAIRAGSGGSVVTVAHGGGEFLAYVDGPGGTLFASPDGVTWTSRAGGTFGGVSLQWRDGAWHSAWPGEGDYRSADGGRTWKKDNTGEFYPMGDTTVGPSGQVYSDGESIWFSAAGKTWEKKLTVDNPATGFNRPVYWNGFYLTARSDGAIFTSAAAGEPTVPALGIEAGVRLSVQTRRSLQYQLQFSPDNRTWTNDGLPVAGDGEPLRIFRPVSPGKKFFRVVER